MSDLEPGSPQWELDVAIQDYKLAQQRVYDATAILLDAERERNGAVRALNEAWEAVHGRIYGG